VKSGLSLLAFCAFVFVELSGEMAGEGPRDWAETAVDDLHFIRATLRENHPGPVDPENPGFQGWYRQGFEKALERARRAKDFAGYFFSIQYYMAGFRDGHLGALTERHLEDHLAETRLNRRWPGFLVGYEEGAFTVRHVEEGKGQAPAVGDRLVACDGRPAEEWARDILEDYVGLWFLPGERSLLAPLLLIDEGNPFVPRPRRCAFESASGTRTLALTWVSVGGKDLLGKLPAAGAESPAIRRAGDAWWITLPTFDLTNSQSGAALKKLTDEVRAKAPAIRSSRAVVFDVRGNRGGSSDAGRALLAAIWGTGFVEQRAPRPAAVEWRLSQGNLRFLRDVNLRTLRRQFGEDSAQARSYEERLKAMEEAFAKGVALFRDVPEAAAPAAETIEVRARPILLTDNVCASACLDFADIVRKLPGAEHVGRETSADAVYIDNRALPLPSGLGFVGFSMKVYRGRARGNNEPYKPSRVWRGDIRDTAALERWILEGPGEKR
jgi:peptidase S41-like protein